MRILSQVQQLRDIKALLDEGILTEAEFKAKKAELLAIKPLEAPPAKKAKQEQCDALVEDCLDEGVLVSGETFKMRSLLASLGGTWSKEVKAYVFSVGSIERIRAGLEASTSPRISVTVRTSSVKDRTERLAKETAAKLDVKNSCAALNVQPYKKSVLVTGDTMKIKTILSALGGRWNRVLGGWIFPLNRADEVLAALREDPTNCITASPELAAQAEPKTNAQTPDQAKSKAASKLQQQHQPVSQPSNVEGAEPKPQAVSKPADMATDDDDYDED